LLAVIFFAGFRVDTDMVLSALRHAQRLLNCGRIAFDQLPAFCHWHRAESHRAFLECTDSRLLMFIRLVLSDWFWLIGSIRLVLRGKTFTVRFVALGASRKLTDIRA
jgi:hypothetical protein